MLMFCPFWHKMKMTRTASERKLEVYLMRVALLSVRPKVKNVRYGLRVAELVLVIAILKDLIYFVGFFLSFYFYFSL